MKTREEIDAIVNEELERAKQNEEKREKERWERHKENMQIGAYRLSVKMTKYHFGEMLNGDQKFFEDRQTYEKAVLAARAYGKRKGMRFMCNWNKARGIGAIERVSIAL